MLYSFEGPSNGTRFDTTGGSILDALYKLPAQVQNDLTTAWRALDAMALTVDVATPWTAERAREWDAMTFATWLDVNVPSAEARQILRVLCTTMIAQEPYTVSFLHILFYIRAADGLVNLVVNEQQYRVVGGTQAPPIKMAQELGSDRLRLSSPVLALNQRDGLVELMVGASGASPSTVTARYAILTGPPAVVNRMQFNPPLPFDKQQLIQRAPMGNSVKLTLAYATNFWDGLGLSGTVLASVPLGKIERPVRTTLGSDVLFSNCFDNSPYTGSGGRVRSGVSEHPSANAGRTPAVLLCFCEGDCSEQMMALPTDAERVSVVTTFLARTFGDAARHPVGFAYEHWAAAPFSAGAYSAFFPPGAWTQQGPSLRAAFGHVRWAGADYATVGNGYINGAIASSEAVANELHQLLHAAAGK